MSVGFYFDKFEKAVLEANTAQYENISTKISIKSLKLFVPGNLVRLNRYKYIAVFI